MEENRIYGGVFEKCWAAASAQPVDDARWKLPLNWRLFKIEHFGHLCPDGGGLLASIWVEV